MIPTLNDLRASLHDAIVVIMHNQVAREHFYASTPDIVQEDITDDASPHYSLAYLDSYLIQAKPRKLTDLVLTTASTLGMVYGYDKAVSLIDLALQTIPNHEPYHRISLFSHTTCADKLMGLKGNLMAEAKRMQEHQLQVHEAHQRFFR